MLAIIELYFCQSDLIFQQIRYVLSISGKDITSKLKFYNLN